MKNFESEYQHAYKNGYKGSYDAYVKLQYGAYIAVCQHCDIQPMQFAEWVAA